jgi:hypothetical protein
MARWRPAAALVLALACCRCPRAGSDASAADPDGRSLVLSSVSQEDPDRELQPVEVNMSGEEAYYMGEQLLIRGQSLQAAAFLARAELLPGDSFSLSHSRGNLASAPHQIRLARSGSRLHFTDLLIYWDRILMHTSTINSNRSLHRHTPVETLRRDADTTLQPESVLAARRAAKGGPRNSNGGTTFQVLLDDLGVFAKGAFDLFVEVLVAVVDVVDVGLEHFGPAARELVAALGSIE